MRLSRRSFLILALPLSLLAVWSVADWWIGYPADYRADYVGSGVCAECHQEESERWRGSYHDLAMDVADPRTVLGDFHDRQYTHFGVTSKMFRRKDAFFITTDAQDGSMETFPIKYVLGVRPLQQYLVEFPDGRVQCLPLAWDTEAKRWFHLYPDEPIPYDDELHWTRPLQNWNYMCAECHTTNLRKDFTPDENRYDTCFSEIDVACETCHGPGSLHVALAQSWSLFWDRRHGRGLPNLKSEDPHVEIETCAPCHARRRIVAAGFLPGAEFLDYYVPELLDGEFYYADGQVLEEDYVYGSFIQSRMYHEGVRCTNCHDPHSTRVKHDDNRLCGQCHVTSEYDTAVHHHHPDASKPGTKCVDCHMPETTYMVVDPRRDHSLRIPRPDLTVALGIPNACTGCHHAQTEGMSAKAAAEWAEKKVRTWYGRRKGPPHFAHAIAAGRQGKREAVPMLLAVSRRTDLPAMVRASAILLLSRRPSDDSLAAALDGLEDDDALVRTASVRAIEGLASSEVARHLAPLLSDPVRSVRVEAARVLSSIPRTMLSIKDREAFDTALAEYIEGQEAVSDHPAAHLNLAVIHDNQGRVEQAEQEYQTALRIDSRFVPARVNLAMLYYGQAKKAEAEKQYRKAIEVAPDVGRIHFSLGLLLAEDPTRYQEVAECMATAARLSPEDARIHYNLGLVLMKLAQPEEAETALKTACKLAPETSDYLVALTTLYAQQKQWPGALACARELVRRWPNDPALRNLLRQVEEQSKEKPPGE